MPILSDLLYEFLHSEEDLRKELRSEILATFDQLKSDEVDESFKENIRIDLINQLEENALTSKDIQKYLIKLITLKFQ